ncbi:hypothetical protein KP79_PYT09028 [Mizuhopecten yessoensis]|uniref:Uncharacterized protein n=1 Tax=Mizuhopecten yessoensis TaxID=6573 RepID=A0A210PI68_MIZYE|nr:hypothetical protein KP79_PYT09028 [Mizuhopecten yessoensis]
MRAECFRPIGRSVSDLTLTQRSRDDLERFYMPTSVVSVQYDVPRVLGPYSSPPHSSQGARPRRPIHLPVSSVTQRTPHRHSLKIEASSYTKSDCLVTSEGQQVKGSAIQVKDTVEEKMYNLHHVDTQGTCEVVPACERGHAGVLTSIASVSMFFLAGRPAGPDTRSLVKGKICWSLDLDKGKLCWPLGLVKGKICLALGLDKGKLCWPSGLVKGKICWPLGLDKGKFCWP